MAGTYVFQLMVTDNKGATGTDTKHSVKQNIVNPADNITSDPVANAAPNVLMQQIPTHIPTKHHGIP